jgi:hypothetical protein
MSISKESGFAVVEALLILVILAIIGGTGYFIWHAKQSSEKSLANASNSQQGIVKASTVTDFASCKAASGSKLLETYPEQCVTKDGKKFTDISDETASWTQYTAPDNSFMMKIPDGWNFDQNSETRGVLQIMDNGLAIRSGVKGTYYVTPGYGKDYDYGFTISFLAPELSENDFAGTVKGATKQASLKTQTGLEIQKYYYKQLTDPGTPGLQAGGQAYIYGIWSGKKLVESYYGFGPTMTDYHTEVEAALQTVKIL